MIRLRKLHIAVRDRSLYEAYLHRVLLIPDITTGANISDFKEEKVLCASSVKFEIIDTTHQDRIVELRPYSTGFDFQKRKDVIERIPLSMVHASDMIKVLGKQDSSQRLGHLRLGFDIQQVQWSVDGFNEPQTMYTLNLPVINDQLSIELQHAPGLLIPIWLRSFRFATDTLEEFNLIDNADPSLPRDDQADLVCCNCELEIHEVGIVQTALPGQTQPKPNFTVDLRYFKPQMPPP